MHPTQKNQGLGTPSARDYLLRRELLRSGLSHSTDPEEVEMESEAEDTAP